MKVPIPLETNCPSIQHQSSPYRSRSGLYSPAVPTIPRETTVLRRSKHPPLKLVLIEHSVFPSITRNPKTLTASSQPFFSWTLTADAHAYKIKPSTSSYKFHQLPKTP